YFAKIGAKTASLFSCAAETAAILSELPERPIAALAAYGYDLGMAFQIVDDVLDFVGDEATLGKPVGSDLRQGNLTLPMMYYLRSAPEQNPVRALFGGDGDPGDEGQVALAIEAVRRSPAIDQALDEAKRYAELAKAEVRALPENRYREALVTLADYTVTRIS